MSRIFLLSFLLFLPFSLLAQSLHAELKALSPTNLLAAVTIPVGQKVYHDSLSLSVAPTGSTLVATAEFPTPLPNPFDKPAYEGIFEFPISLNIPLQPDSQILLSYQACSDSMCFPPEQLPLLPERPAAKTIGDLVGFDTAQYKLESCTLLRTLSGACAESEFLAFLHGEAKSESFLDKAHRLGGVLLLIPALLLGGFLLNLSPCVLPLIPVNLALIGAGVKRSSRRQGLLFGSAFGLGIALCFGLLGVLTALIGQSFGSFHASPIFNTVVAIVFCLLTLAMLDVLHIDFSHFRRTAKRRSSDSASPLLRLLAAFGAGAGSALLSGACVAPVLISTFLLTADFVNRGYPILGASLPFLLGLGMALPWPFLAAGFVLLPKPGAWMNFIKQLFALIFLLTALFYLFQAFRQIRPISESDKTPELPVVTDPGTAILLAKSTERPIFVELHADWCKACRKMQKTTLRKPAVRKALSDFVYLSIDCTDLQNPEVQAILRFTNGVGLPHYACLELKQ